MNIVIVGAGIAGLTAAVALTKKGHNVRVFEQSLLKEKTGLGVGLQDFAVDALSNLGLSSLLSEGILIKRTSFYTRKGHLLYAGNLNTSFNKGKLGVRRSVVLSQLLDEANNLIGENNIYPGYQLISFQQNLNQVKATFRDRKNNSSVEINADLLIGADGLHSTVRSILFPNTNSIKFSGIITWRGFTHFHDFSNQEMLLMGDRFAKTVIYPVKALPNHQIEYYWAAEVLQKNNTLSNMPQDKAGKFEEFAPQFEDFKYKNIKIIDIYQKAHKIFRFPIVDKDPINHWVRNRAVLIGDAAHPMYPMGGNGASQAIIDAVTLAHDICEASNLRQALESFSLKRVNKVNKVVASNRELGPDKILVSDKTMSDTESALYYRKIINEYRQLTNP